MTTLVTLNYLRQKVEEARARDIGQIAMELAWGPRDRAQVTSAKADPDWFKNGIVHVEIEQLGGHGKDLTAKFDITFGQYFYDTGGGRFDLSNCRSTGLPSDTSTGEFQTFNNVDGPSDITVDDTHSVTESKSSSTTLDESVQISNSLTLEAGTDIAKASDTLETTFGIDKSKTEDQSETTETSVEVTGIVPKGRDVRVVYTVKPSTTVCDVNMSALVDWADLRVELFTDWVSHYPWVTRHNWVPWNNNRSIIDHSEWVDGNTLKLTRIDDLLRIFNGTTSRCTGCDGLSFTSRAHDAFARLRDPSYRHVSWSGTQTMHAKSDAGYTFLDVTGFTEECLARFSKAGVTATELGRC